MHIRLATAGALLGLAATANAGALQTVDDQVPPWTIAVAKDTADNGTTSCGTEAVDGVRVQWCTQNGAEFDRTRVLWYLHGLNEPVDSYITSAAYTRVKAYWRYVHGVAPPVMIAISFGASWTLSDLPSRHVSGSPVLYSLFVDRVLPRLERKLLGETPPGARWLMGKSMGGYNSALLLEKDPRLWNKVVLGCAALFTITPFSSGPERNAYVARNVNASREAVDHGLWVLGKDEPKLEAWLRNDPLAPMRLAALDPGGPPLFIWFNGADGYGFAEGAGVMIAAALAAGVKVTSASNTGNHCLMDPAIEMGIAEFLQ